MIRSKKLFKHKEISHGFFDRMGGVSSGIYKSLNCGTGSNDKKYKVKKNLNIVKKKIAKKTKNIVLLNQIHSNKFVFFSKKSKSYNKQYKADAIITNQSKLPIAVLTADCVPILLYENKKKMIAAIHAGWRGAYKGIVHKVIRYMLKRGCKIENFTAAIGPCIGFNNYNVKTDFKNKFLKKDKKNRVFFTKKNGIIFFNLPNYIKSQIKLNKITNIDMKNTDTFKKKNNFFSARRSLSLKHEDYGRNISIIMIN